MQPKLTMLCLIYCFQLKEEIWVAYLSILAMCNQLKGSKSASKSEDGASSSMETSLNDSSVVIKVTFKKNSIHIHNMDRCSDFFNSFQMTIIIRLNVMLFFLKPGLLSSSLEELKHLLRELANVDGMETGAMNSQLELEMRLHSAEESLNKMERYLTDKTDENKRLKEHATQLTSKFIIMDLYVLYIYMTIIRAFTNDSICCFL